MREAMQRNVWKSWEAARTSLALCLPCIKTLFQPNALFHDLRSLHPCTQICRAELQENSFTLVLVRRQPCHLPSKCRTLDAEVQLPFNIRGRRLKTREA